MNLNLANSTNPSVIRKNFVLETQHFLINKTPYYINIPGEITHLPRKRGFFSKFLIKIMETFQKHCKKKIYKEPEFLEFPKDLTLSYSMSDYKSADGCEDSKDSSIMSFGKTKKENENIEICDKNFENDQDDDSEEFRNSELNKSNKNPTKTQNENILSAKEKNQINISSQEKAENINLEEHCLNEKQSDEENLIKKSPDQILLYRRKRKKEIEDTHYQNKQNEENQIKIGGKKMSREVITFFFII